MDEFRTLWESENGQQMACIIAYGVGLLPTHEGENNTIVEASLRLAESQIPTDKTIAMYLLENIYKGRNAAMQLNDTSQNDI